MAYVYPRAKRQTRDLLRRRSFFVRQRAQLIALLSPKDWKPSAQSNALGTDTSNNLQPEGLGAA